MQFLITHTRVIFQTEIYYNNQNYIWPKDDMYIVYCLLFIVVNGKKCILQYMYTYIFNFVHVYIFLSCKTGNRGA